MRLSPSISRIEVFAGSIRRKFERRVIEPIRAIDPANSTPVGPAPTNTNVICLARSFASASVLRGGMFGKLVMTEITRSHPSGQHQIIERDLLPSNDWGDSVERSGSQIDAGHFRHSHGKVLLFLGRVAELARQLPKWRESRLPPDRAVAGRCGDSTVDQNDFGVAPSKRSRGCNPSEASADYHDPRRLVPVHLHLGGLIVGLSHDQCFPRFRPGEDRPYGHPGQRKMWLPPPVQNSLKKGL